MYRIVDNLALEFSVMQKPLSGTLGLAGSPRLREGSIVSNKLLTVNEVAKILRVSNMTVYRLVKNKQIPAIRVGKNYRIKEIDVDSYLNRGSG